MNDVADRVYYSTKLVRRNGNSGTVYIEREWGLERGDIVEVTLWNIDNPSRKVTGIKKLCPRGSGLVFFCSKIWGLEIGTLIVFRLKKVADADGRVMLED